jgi:hypothetical protein
MPSWTKGQSATTNDKMKDMWTKQSAAQTLLDLSSNYDNTDSQPIDHVSSLAQEIPTPSTPQPRFATLAATTPSTLHDIGSTTRQFTYLPTPPETPERPIQHQNHPISSIFYQSEVNLKSSSSLAILFATTRSPRPSLPGTQELREESRRLAIEHGTLLGNQLVVAKRMRMCREARERKRMGRKLVGVFGRGGVRRSRVVVLKIRREGLREMLGERMEIEEEEEE